MSIAMAICTLYLALCALCRMEGWTRSVAHREARSAVEAVSGSEKILGTGCCAHSVFHFDEDDRNGLHSLSLCTDTLWRRFPSLSVHVATDSTTGSLNALYSSEYIECPVDNVGGRCCLGMRAVSRWWFGRVPQVVGGLYPNSNRIESNINIQYPFPLRSDPTDRFFTMCFEPIFFSPRLSLYFGRNRKCFLFFWCRPVPPRRRMEWRFVLLRRC